MLLDLTKLLAVLERIATALENGAKDVVADVESAGTRRGPGRPKSTTTAAATAAAVAAAQPAASAQPAPDAVPQPTLQQVADAIIDLANNVSRDKAVAILTKFGVKKVPELKP